MSILLLIAALGASPADEKLPTPAELFARYRKNFDGMATLKVQWRRDHEYTEDWRLMEEKRLEELAARLAATPEESPDYHTLRQQLMHQKQATTTSFVPKTSFQTFVTDRTRFMMRIAPANWGATHGDDDWLMPDVAVTPESMKAVYPGFTLLSYQGNAADGFRTWTPQPYSAGYGMIQPGFPATDGTFFPPLGTDRKGFSTQRHAIDGFFDADPSEFKSVGRATIDGHETVIVERDEISKAPSLTADEAKAHAGRIVEFAVVRAYIDPKRGGLPLKIEWDGYRLYDEKPLPRPKSSRPYRVLAVTEIKEVEGAGFYPARGTDTTYGQDPKFNGPANTIANMIAGKVVEIPTVAYERTSWHAAKVEANIALTESFKMAYPDGAYYYNQITGMNEQAGWEKRDGTQLPWALTGVLLTGWVVCGIVAAVRASSHKSRPAAKRRAGMAA